MMESLFLDDVIAEVRRRDIIVFLTRRSRNQKE
jgi:hypothetical protein